MRRRFLAPSVLAASAALLASLVPAAAAADDPPNLGWHRDRIDQRRLPLDGRYGPVRTGRGVTAYVVGHAVAGGHPAFGGRVQPGWSVTGGTGIVANDDPCRFGTYEAGLLGASDLGVAPGVTIKPVAALRCEGNVPGPQLVADLVAGLDWVVADHDPGEPAVVSFPAAYAASAELDAAAQRVIADGVQVFASAGYRSSPVSGPGPCFASPARVQAVVTVAGTAPDDSRFAGSWYGSCVDLFAPAVNVYASDPNGGHVSRETPDAAVPLAAGVAALYLETEPAVSPSWLRYVLLGSATTRVVRNAGSGSPNLLLNAWPAHEPRTPERKDRFGSGYGLLRGRTMTSPSGFYVLDARTDGDIVLRTVYGQVLWRVGRRSATWLTLDGTGNLKAFDRGRGLWSSGSNGGPSTAVIQDDGRLVVYRDADGRAGFGVGTAAALTPPRQPVGAGSWDVTAGQGVHRGGYVMVSANKRFEAVLRGTDGRLVVRERATGRVVWAAPPVGAADWASVQPDGNLVLHRRDGRALWATGTAGRGRATLRINDDGTLGLLGNGDTWTWTSTGRPPL